MLLKTETSPTAEAPSGRDHQLRRLRHTEDPCVTSSVIRGTISLACKKKTEKIRTGHPPRRDLQVGESRPTPPELANLRRLRPRGIEHRKRINRRTRQPTTNPPPTRHQPTTH